ncbi:hypothetical protein [Thiothrix winogradskyi]|uniref:Lipoprotein n=1 Tax=Thiothrix winogradskyi TaxID=96472 RepID=A0ABY3SU75_9GAMM|nr:hypothetical protein [Thiothrix winogradskyi]UJS22743.1 hypothetical protein L2Y54_12405 [Thiothrix winogradskyi]
MNKKSDVLGRAVFSPKCLSYAIVICSSLLTGCSNLPLLGMADDSVEINPSNLDDYVRNQDDVYKGLLQLASLAGEPASPAEWNQFIMAGVQYSNQKCEIYLNSAMKGDADIAARYVIHNLQRQYVEKLVANQYSNRVAAFSALQGYGKLCSPNNVQALKTGNARIAQPGKATDGGVNLVPYVRIEP